MFIKKIDLEEIKNRFYYDETSPSFLRYAIDIPSGRSGKRIRCKKDSVAGCIYKKTGYYSVIMHGVSYSVHRIIFSLFYGDISDKLIDHLDGCRTNNKIENLRCADIKTNARNRILQENNKSGVTGVHKLKRKDGDVFAAKWVENGISKRKTFSISKYGHDEAFRLACEYRQQKIKELINQGDSYTERHGK